MAMTVKDLINQLSELDGDLIVGFATDEEGNSVNEFYELGYAVYNENGEHGQRFSGYIYGEDDDETEVTEETATAVILWP